MSGRGVNLSSQAKMRVSEDPSRSFSRICGSPVPHWAPAVASVGTGSSEMTSDAQERRVATTEPATLALLAGNVSCYSRQEVAPRRASSS